MAARTVHTGVGLEVLTAANLAKYPKGWLGHAERTSNQNGIGTSPTDLTGLTVTVDVPADRLIKISGYVQVNPGTTATVTVTVVEDGVTIGRIGKTTPYASSESSLSGFTLSIAPSAGSHTYKLQGEASTGTFDLQAAAVAPSTILVEDVGPST